MMLLSDGLWCCRVRRAETAQNFGQDRISIIFGDLVGYGPACVGSRARAILSNFGLLERGRSCDGSGDFVTGS